MEKSSNSEFKILIEEEIKYVKQNDYRRITGRNSR
jgi:hypothetical protein